jgi:hypothetical protein
LRKSRSLEEIDVFRKTDEEYLGNLRMALGHEASIGVLGMQ